MNELSSPLIEQARVEADVMLEAERQLGKHLQAYWIATWEFGRSLAPLKEAVGHSHWMFFVANNFPQLGNKETTRVNRANDARGFFEANPNYPSSGNFTVESVRKFIFRLAPEKERPQLQGNEKIPATPHQLTFVNVFTKWDRQCEIGLVQRPPIETLRNDLEPLVKRIVELAGTDWVASLLSGG